MTLKHFVSGALILPHQERQLTEAANARTHVADFHRCQDCGWWAPYEVLRGSEAAAAWYCLRHLPRYYRTMLERERPELRHSAPRPCGDIQDTDPLNHCASTFVWPGPYVYGYRSEDL